MTRDSRRTVLSFMSEDAQRRSKESQTDTVHRLSLNDIRPDPGQPRHLLPSALAAQLHTGDIPPLIVLKKLIESGETDEALANTIKRIAELATDIKGNGLISPITVYKPEGRLTHYTIETGERRYWAHWYLVHQGDESFRQIRALIVDGKNSRIRQLSENLRRDGLSAVETAIGLASLIAELQDKKFDNWYEGETLVPTMLRQLIAARLKRGTWPQVIERLGYGRRHWHNYLNLLKLCDEALEIAHRNRLPERRLRPITAIENPIAQKLAVSTLLTGDTPAIATRNEKAHKTPGSATRQAPIEKWQRAMKNLHRSFETIPAEDINLIRATVATDADRRQLLTEVRDRLNEILAEE